VTPEKAVLDETCEFVVLPMFDGESGVLPGRAPFVGELGPGELRVKTGDKTQRYFVDGGFAQVNADNINVLTSYARKPEEITEALLTSETAKAEALPESNPTELATKKRMRQKLAAMAAVKARN
jgi:F-type H+-transporting ATPase subunit epsilon